MSPLCDGANEFTRWTQAIITRWGPFKCLLVVTEPDRVNPCIGEVVRRYSKHHFVFVQNYSVSAYLLYAHDRCTRDFKTSPQVVFDACTIANAQNLVLS